MNFQYSDFLLLVLWFVTLVMLYVIIRIAVADGMKDFHNKKEGKREHFDM